MHSWASATEKPGTASSSSSVARLRLIRATTVPDAVLANGTLTCSPSRRRPARLGSPRAHTREGFVTGRVEEHDLAPVGGGFRIHDLHFVSANVLRDSAGFALGHGCRTY